MGRRSFHISASKSICGVETPRRTSRPTSQQAADNGRRMARHIRRRRRLEDSIRQLREALEDDAESPIYIQTAHRRGYRFIGNAIPPGVGAITAHEVAPAARSAQESPGLRLPPIGTRILGREAKLGKMRSWLDRALSGKRQTVFVTGEPWLLRTPLKSLAFRALRFRC